MGLDISVMKPKKVEVVSEDDYSYKLEDNPELEIFKDFAIDKFVEGETFVAYQ